MSRLMPRRRFGDGGLNPDDPGYAAAINSYLAQGYDQPMAEAFVRATGANRTAPWSEPGVTPRVYPTGSTPPAPALPMAVPPPGSLPPSVPLTGSGSAGMAPPSSPASSSETTETSSSSGVTSPAAAAERRRNKQPQGLFSNIQQPWLRALLTGGLGGLMGGASTDSTGHGFGIGALGAGTIAALLSLLQKKKQDQTSDDDTTKSARGGPIKEKTMQAARAPRARKFQNGGVNPASSVAGLMQQRGAGQGALTGQDALNALAARSGVSPQTIQAGYASQMNNPAGEGGGGAPSLAARQAMQQAMLAPGGMFGGPGGPSIGGPPPAGSVGGPGASPGGPPVSGMGPLSATPPGGGAPPMGPPPGMGAPSGGAPPMGPPPGGPGSMGLMGGGAPGGGASFMGAPGGGASFMGALPGGAGPGMPPAPGAPSLGSFGGAGAGMGPAGPPMAAANMPQLTQPAASIGSGLPASNLNTLRAGLGSTRPMRPYRKGGKVADSDAAADSDTVAKKRRPDRQWGDTESNPDNEARKKGGAIAKAKGGTVKRPKVPKVSIAVVSKKPPVSTPSPYDSEGPGDTPVASAPSAPPPGLSPAMKGGGKVKAKEAKAKAGKRAVRKSKGGKCKKMAAGGAAKQRKGFPNTNAVPQRLAKGGKVRGCGAATKGCTFSGIY